MSLLWRMTQGMRFHGSLGPWDRQSLGAGRTKDTDNSAFSAAVWAAEAWWNHWVHLRQVN